MKLLLLVPQYLDLYKPIIEELKNQGNKVEVIFDEQIPKDPYKRCQGMQVIKQLIKKIVFWYIIRKYWKTKIKEENVLNLYYDIFLCIDGCSFDNYLLKKLKNVNPSIRSIIYLWDTSKYYDFIRNIKYFDKVLSFDIEDCHKYNMIYLPFYWKPTNVQSPNILYKMSIIGSNHDGRLEIVEKIAKQLDENNLNYYFKLYMPQRSLKHHEVKSLNKAIKEKDFSNVRYYKPLSGEVNSDFITNNVISVDEVNRIISQSEIIFDTDRKSQTGTTPRLIWALAMGKKIVTTNENIMRMPFYNAEYISIIDRDNPILDMNFIHSNTSQSKQFSLIMPYRIDNWIKSILSE